jgi:RNA-directed DNA polymerase
MQVKKLRIVVDSRKFTEQAVLIKSLSPVIIGWTRYYSTVVSKTVFAYLDHLLFAMLLAWTSRRHPNKSKTWIAHKYWNLTGEKTWSFRTPSGKFQLPRHDKTPIRRHVKVEGDRSLYDGDWGARLGRHPDVPAKVSKLLKKQKGTCWECGLYFRDGDLMEVDHIISLAIGGKDVFHNLQLLHRHCHDQKTARDQMAAGTNDNRRMIEEPDESKECAAERAAESLTQSGEVRRKYLWAIRLT